MEKRKNSIDLVKFIMAIVVIAIHTRPFINCVDSGINSFLNTVMAMAVPFFFITSGYLLAKKMTFPYEANDVLKIKKYLIKIVKMYLIWTIIYTPIAIWHNIASNDSFGYALLLYIRGLFFVGEHYNSYPLWYLLSTIYALIMIMFLIKQRITAKGLLIFSFIMSFISFGLDYIVNYTGAMSVPITMFRNLIVYTVANGRILRGAIYIPIGMILANKKLPQWLNILLFITAFILDCIIIDRTLSSYLTVVTMVGFFGLVESIDSNERVFYSILANLSTVMYLLHMYVWSFYYKIVYGEKTYGVDCFVVTLIVTIVISAIYLAIKQTQNKRVTANRQIR